MVGIVQFIGKRHASIITDPSSHGKTNCLDVNGEETRTKASSAGCRFQSLPKADTYRAEFISLLPEISSIL